MQQSDFSIFGTHWQAWNLKNHNLGVVVGIQLASGPSEPDVRLASL